MLDLVPIPKRSVAAAAIFLALLGALVALDAEGSQVRYHGNTSSKVFHKLSCRYANCTHDTKELTSREAAIAAGYEACKICKP